MYRINWSNDARLGCLLHFLFIRNTLSWTSGYIAVSVPDMWVINVRTTTALINSSMLGVFVFFVYLCHRKDLDGLVDDNFIRFLLYLLTYVFYGIPY